MFIGNIEIHFNAVKGCAILLEKYCRQNDPQGIIWHTFIRNQNFREDFLQENSLKT